MRENMITNFVKVNAMNMEVGTVKKWSSVDIEFLNDNKAKEDTSFDVENVLTNSGLSELDALFAELCKESGIKNPVITSVTVTCSAATKSRLEDMTR